MAKRRTDNLPENEPARAATTLIVWGPDGEIRPLKDITDDLFRIAFHHCGGSPAAIAASLGIGRSTVYRRLAEMGLPEPAGDHPGDADRPDDAQDEPASDSKPN